MAFEDLEDFFDFRFGPFHMSSGARPFKVGYARTSESHIVTLKLGQDIKKEEIKVRLHEGGVLEIEWPRKTKGEGIPIELWRVYDMRKAWPAELPKSSRFKRS